MSFPDSKKQFLQAVGFTPDEIVAVEQTFETLADKAQNQNLRSKETSVETVTSNPAPATLAQAASQDDQVKQAQDFIVKALEPVMSQINARLAALEASLAQQQSLSPAASTLAAKSITEQEGSHVISGRGDKGPKENNADKEAAPTPNVTGITFVDNLIALNRQAMEKRVGG